MGVEKVNFSSAHAFTKIITLIKKRGYPQWITSLFL